MSVHEDAREPVAGLGSQPSENAKDKDQGDGSNSNESNMAAKALHMEIHEKLSGNLASPCDNINNNEGSDMSFLSGINVLNFGEYDLETGQRTEQPETGTNLHHIKHQIGGVEASVPKSACMKKEQGRQVDLSLQKYRQSQAVKRMPMEHTDEKVQALAENTWIGSLEKSKFTNKRDTRESAKTLTACSSSEMERQQSSSISQLEPSEMLMEETGNRVKPPEYLTDTGFIDMFSSDHVTGGHVTGDHVTGGHVTDSHVASNRPHNINSSLQTVNCNNNNERKSEKSPFRIKPEYLTQSRARKVTETHWSVLAPCSFTRRKYNELFDIDPATVKDSCQSCAINSLPCSLILEIFNYLTPCCLLR